MPMGNPEAYGEGQGPRLRKPGKGGQEQAQPGAQTPAAAQPAPFQPLPSTNPQFMTKPVQQRAMAGELPEPDGLDKMLKMLFGVI